MKEVTFGGRWSEFHPQENGDIVVVTGEQGKGPDHSLTLPAFVVPVLRIYFMNEGELP